MSIGPNRETPADEGPPARPKIGLALGSGVARGWAHIGVIRRLIEAGIEPDVVAGTSIGAVVGGCYLANKLDEVEEFARSLTGRRLLSLLDLRFGGSGLIGGRRLKAELDKYLGDIQIEFLGRTFVAVAAELATGHEIWLRDGPMVDAMSASYALPGVFSPVKRNRRWLIDGALVNPVPVSVCRAFGARVVIAVNLNVDAFGRGESGRPSAVGTEDFEEGFEAASSITQHIMRPDRYLMRQLFGTREGKPGMSTVMLAALTIVQDRLARSRLAGDPPDVMITPGTAHIGLLEFDRADEAIRLGEQAADEMIPYIKDVLDFLG